MSTNEPVLPPLMNPQTAPEAPELVFVSFAAVK